MKKETVFSTSLMAALCLLLACLTFSVRAQQTLDSVVPENGTLGVSTTATVVFTFNSAIDTNTVVVSFQDISQNEIPISSSWNAGFTVLSCKAITSFPPNSFVIWTLDAPPDIFESGGFLTSSGGGGNTGSGTNRYTSFAVGKLHYYHQTNDVVTLDDQIPYFFLASRLPRELPVL
jgi:hypothetical protein